MSKRSGLDALGGLLFALLASNSLLPTRARDVIQLPYRSLLATFNSPSQPPREICQDTCNKARNGMCEEGRRGKVPVTTTTHMAYCDLGTDCEDCGPWLTTGNNITWENPAGVGPIRFLKAKDLQVRVRNAAVPPGINFAFAYTNPQMDFDVSYRIESSSMLEAGITTIVYKTLNKRCVRPDGSRALVVDVGANFGWFSVLAARMGCRVIAFEPVPVFRAFLTYNVHINDLASLVDVRSTVVSHETGKHLRMVVPSRGMWGAASIEGLNVDTSMQSDHNTIEVPTVRLEDEVRSDVQLLKIDVQGWEWAVIKGAAGLLKGFEVENIVMEYAPGVPERHHRFADMMAHPLMLSDLIAKYDYRIGNVGDAAKHQSAGWDMPLPELREVTMDNLKYDIEDIKRWQAGKLACPTPPELEKFPAWLPCGGVPDGFNPRSFRSELTHSTSLWLRRTSAIADGLLWLEGVSGILEPSDPADKYFGTREVVMGSRSCDALERKWQVKNRCRCSVPDQCGEEEEAVEKAAEAGKLPQNYVLK